MFLFWLRVAKSGVFCADDLDLELNRCKLIQRRCAMPMPFQLVPTMALSYSFSVSSARVRAATLSAARHQRPVSSRALPRMTATLEKLVADPGKADQVRMMRPAVGFSAPALNLSFSSS